MSDLLNLHARSRRGPGCDVIPVTLPGDLTSPTAGPILRRGTPVIEAMTGDVATVVWISPKPNAKGAYAVRTYVVEDDVECGTRAAASHFALDLSDPAGMDIAARWLARHHGLTVGATAPGWVRDGAEWRLIVPLGREGDYYEQTDGRRFASTHRGVSEAPIVVPGISALDPAAALALACLAAVGRAA